MPNRRAFQPLRRFGRGQLAREVDDEIAFHIETRTERLIANGMSADDARAEALRQFGAVESVREHCVTYDEDRERMTRRANRFDELRQDFVYAVRTLRRNIGFTAVIVLTIALAVGANSAIFTLIDAVLLRKLDVRNPDELVVIGNPARTSSLSTGGASVDIYSYPLYRDVLARNSVMTDVLASGRPLGAGVLFDGAKQAEGVRLRFVSANYFSVLGVGAAAGRLLTADDDRAPGASPVVVISHAFWMRRFQGDARAIGGNALINGVRLTIAGVAAEGWTGEIVGDPREMWIPLSMQPILMPHEKMLEDRGASWLLLLGRLRPGVNIEQARSHLAPLIRTALLESNNELPPSNRMLPERVATLDVPVSAGARGLSRVRFSFQNALLTLMAGVVVLLLIVCANVANLLLARAVARGREMSVRLALGAGRTRIVRQLLTESVVLGLMGAAGGLAVATWGSRLLLVFGRQTTGTLKLGGGFDVRVVGFTLAVTMLCVMLFGLVPALRSAGVDLASSLRTGGRGLQGAAGSRGRRRPAGALLIAAQVALSLMLLAGTGLLVRSLKNLETADTGVDRDHLLIADVNAAGRGYSGEKLEVMARDLSERLSRIPGVAAVAYSENGLFSGTESSTSLQVEGFTARASADTFVNYDVVSRGYAQGTGGRIVAGRDLDDRDLHAGSLGALINETMAKFYFPASTAIGKHVALDSARVAEIVGVIADVKDHDLRASPVRRLYWPYVDQPVGSIGGLRFEIRAARDPATLIQLVRTEIRSFDAQLAIQGVDPLSRLMRDSIQQERLLARLAMGFGLMALLIASVGLYGVVSYSVSRRTGEIGLRVALGAQRPRVIRMVIGDAGRLVMLGVVVGVPAALASVRLLRSQLHGVSETDPIAIGGAVVVLLAASIGASLLPALRAAKVPPMVAFRQE